MARRRGSGWGLNPRRQSCTWSPQGTEEVYHSILKFFILDVSSGGG
jgi:hypothetical protein